MNKAIEITAANLRQRMLNEKGTEVVLVRKWLCIKLFKYLHRGIEAALATAENDPQLVSTLITGRQVDLAEEIKFIKNITDLLKCLNERLQHESIWFVKFFVEIVFFCWAVGNVLTKILTVFYLFFTCTCLSVPFSHTHTCTNDSHT